MTYHDGRAEAEETAVPHNGRQRWRVGAGVAVAFLVFPAYDIATSGRGVLAVVASLVVLLAFAALYVLVTPLLIGSSSPARLLLPVAMFALSWALLPALGWSFTYLWIFVSVDAASLLPMAATAGVAILLAAGMVGFQLAFDAADPPWELALTLIAMSVWMSGFMKNVRVNQQLRDARAELATLAVAAERQRIARDLHDILGHSLTAIALKAALARRLVDRDPAAATAEIADVERLAREALSDVRSTASGMRDVTLAGELAIANSVLRSAGVNPILPSAVDDVPAAGREVFGFVVREAVTNVVRHADATRCTVTVTPRSVEIVDDGRGSTTPAGNGLSGLAERVRSVGGRLTAGPGPEGGYRVLAEL